MKYVLLQKDGGEIHQKTYGNLCHIGGQWVSNQNELTFHYFLRIKRVAQLALQEPNFICQFNFSLVLPDILANKGLGESARPSNFFSNLMYLSHLSRPMPMIKCFCFSILLKICFSFMSSQGTRNLFPRSRSEFQVRPLVFLSDTVVKNPKEQP